MKRIMSIVLSALLVMALPLQVCAEDYDLSVGNITVTADDSGQYVQQENNTSIDSTANEGKGHKETTATVISGTNKPDSSTSPAITVNTSGDATANITVENVTITSAGTAIEVGASNATITVEGTNTVTTTESNSAGTYCGEAAIHVSSGNLTITGGAGDTLDASVTHVRPDSSNQTAVIGSNAYEDLDGSITIQGDLTVNAKTDGNGAAIGSGFSGDVNGTIAIQGGTVNAEGNSGAIGTGTTGMLNTGGSIEISGGTVNATADRYTAIGGDYMNGGSITISGGTVNATGGDDGGAGIGAKYTNGSNSDGGSITITGGNVTAAGGKWGAGIGNASSSALTADITISGGTVTAIGGDDSAGIGGGKGTGVESDITIGGNATVIAQAGQATQAVAPNAIGNGSNTQEHSWADGSVTITDNAQVYLADNGTTKPEAPYFPGSGTTVSGNAAVTQSSEDALAIRDKVLAEQNKPAESAPAPAPQVTLTAYKAPTTSFWDEIIWRLTKLEAGNTFTIDVGTATWVPRSVIQAAQSAGVTLIIQWDGGSDITVAPTDKIDLTLWEIKLAELA